MTTRTATRFFPRSRAFLLHQDGSQRNTPSEGVEVVLHTREGDKEPCCAEVISGEHVAEIGLSFEDGELTEYDGVFYLPREVGEMLTDAGYVVPDGMYR